MRSGRRFLELLLSLNLSSVVVHSFDSEVKNDKLFLKWLRRNVYELPHDANAWWNVFFNYRVESV